MTQSPNTGAVPEFTVGDRLGRALRHANVSAAEMASYLDVHRNTISAYINDRQPVKVSTLRLWAMRTGVSFEWLSEGVESAPTPPRGGGEPAPNTTLGQLTTRKRARTQATREGVSTPRYGAAA